MTHRPAMCSPSSITTLMSFPAQVAGEQLGQRGPVLPDEPARHRRAARRTRAGQDLFADRLADPGVPAGRDPASIRSSTTCPSRSSEANAEYACSGTWCPSRVRAHPSRATRRCRRSVLLHR
jgi:hypothetical protein